MAEETSQHELLMITKEHLETGLRGYPVGYCTTSSVDSERGLFYRGHPVTEMVEWDPIEVIYFLYHGAVPTDRELKKFTNEINSRSRCSEELLQAIEALPGEGEPMKLLSSALLLCGMVEGRNDYEEDCLNVVAKIPILTAAVINHHAGWGGIAPSDPQRGYMDNFAQMLNVPGANVTELARVFKLFNVLHYDHGGGNLSCFIGKGVASGLEDMYGALTASMCALSGPRHGKANQDSLLFVQRCLDAVGPEATGDQVEAYVRDCLSNQQLVYGFGHAVLRVEDPRATIFYDIAETYYPYHPLVKMALLLRERAPQVLSERAKISNPFPNVDAISGVVLSAAGFPYPQYFTVLFGLARCVGVARQIVYERLEARDGKGTPIIRPKYFFKSA